MPRMDNRGALINAHVAGVEVCTSYHLMNTSSNFIIIIMRESSNDKLLFALVLG